MNVILFILFAAVTATFGQLGFKLGVNQVGEVSKLSPSVLLEMVFNPYVLIGLFLYGVSTISWLVALSKEDLNFVYAFTSLILVMVFLLSFAVLGESVSIYNTLGYSLIILGLLIIFFYQR
ncbi:MAG: hypothetical protein PHI16_05970 [Methanocellales archaeon]|nr:hypothetical protein [Methanocellales archaeon]